MRQLKLGLLLKPRGAAQALLCATLVACGQAPLDCEEEPEHPNCGPQFVARSPGGPLQLDGGRFYWRSSGASNPGEFTGPGGAINSMALDGSDSKVVTKAPFALFCAVRDGHVAWVTLEAPLGQERKPLTVMHLPRGAAAPVQLYTGPGIAEQLTLDATGVLVPVYWEFTPDSASGSGAVVSAPVTGGEPKVLATPVPWPQVVALQGDRAYWATNPRNDKNLQVDGTVEFASAEGGPINVLFSAFDPVHFLVSSEAFYAIGCKLAGDEGNCNFADPWMLIECPLAGCGAANELGRLHSSTGHINSAVADATGLYYLVVETGSVPPTTALMKLARSASAPEIIRSGIPHAFGLLMNETHFFWEQRNNTEGYAIWTLPR